ncbi:MAG: YwaF family protein [Erysipelotrichia bacterium]|nr:YwaF family protein [Erysipelotrichia bacterium]
MYNILSYTAWSMNKFKAYGLIHLVLFLGGLLISFCYAYYLRYSSEKKTNKILFGCGIFLLLSEIYKQLFYTYYLHAGTYPYWIFPFQLCSIPMYLCLIIPFVKKEKLKQGIYNFMASFNLMGGFIAFLEPSGLIHEYITLTAHAFIWHMLLIFIGLLIIFTGHAEKQLKDFNQAALLYLSFCFIAFMINLLLFNVSDGSINMFFIGPAKSSLIVFKQICNYSVLLSSIIYIVGNCLAAGLFYFIGYKIKK